MTAAMIAYVHQSVDAPDPAPPGFWVGAGERSVFEFVVSVELTFALRFPRLFTFVFVPLCEFAFTSEFAFTFARLLAFVSMLPAGFEAPFEFVSPVTLQLAFEFAWRFEFESRFVFGLGVALELAVLPEFEF
jgi:hypothetical protein